MNKTFHQNTRYTEGAVISSYEDVCLICPVCWYNWASGFQSLDHTTRRLYWRSLKGRHWIWHQPETDFTTAANVSFLLSTVSPVFPHPVLILSHVLCCMQIFSPKQSKQLSIIKLTNNIVGASLTELYSVAFSNFKLAKWILPASLTTMNAQRLAEETAGLHSHKTEIFPLKQATLLTTEHTFPQNMI